MNEHSENSFLVTGGAGFIGSHFIEEALKHENVHRIIVIDDLSTGKLENLPVDDRIEFHKGDISNFDFITSFFSKYHFDYIVHLAAIASVQDSIDNPVGAHRVNFDSTLNLLECAKKQGDVKRFLFSSSAAVYGDKPDLPCKETSNINPISPYGIDKYASERFVINYSKLFGVPSTAFRFFNVYGPRQNPSSPYSGVISIFADRILNKNGELTIFGDGSQTRDFVFVKDVISIIQYTMHSFHAIGEVFNVGTGIETSLNELAWICADVSHKEIKINHKEARKGDIRHSVSDISKLREIGYDKSFIYIEKGISFLFDSLVKT